MSIFDDEIPICPEFLNEFGFEYESFTHRWIYKIYEDKKSWKKYIMSVVYDEKFPNHLSVPILYKIYEVNSMRDIELVIESLKSSYTRKY